MEKFEKTPEQINIQKQRDEISLRASEMPEFQQAVREAKTKTEAIQAIRVLLKEKYPEISNIPEEPQKEAKKVTTESPRVENLGSLFGSVSNEFKIAKDIVGLLWENN